MEPSSTLSLAIRCASCNDAFRARLATGSRLAWRQRSVPGDHGALMTAYLCGRCSAEFDSDHAALDFLAQALERRGAPRGRRPKAK